MLNDKINQWVLSLGDGPVFQQINERLDYLARVLFSDYEPMIGPFPEYWQRLEAWVENVIQEDDQKLLFRLAAQLYFVGARELDNLYRVAFNANVCQWLIDQLYLSLDDAQLEVKVSRALERTWFCPVTDSMRINAFYHLNHISGRDFRPDWNSLALFGDSSKVSAFLTNNIDRIVLLEDFVGTGSQVSPAIDFLRDLPHRPPSLLVPLIICPEGIASAARWRAENPTLTVSPVIRLQAHNFIGPNPSPNEPTTFPSFRSLVTRTYRQVLNGADPVGSKTYTPFGFQSIGSLVVLATNCPDNTLPLVHYKSDAWSPLFPRASRI